MFIVLFLRWNTLSFCSFSLMMTIMLKKYIFCNYQTFFTVIEWKRKPLRMKMNMKRVKNESWNVERGEIKFHLKNKNFQSDFSSAVFSFSSFSSDSIHFDTLDVSHIIRFQIRIKLQFHFTSNSSTRSLHMLSRPWPTSLTGLIVRRWNIIKNQFQFLQFLSHQLALNFLPSFYCICFSVFLVDSLQLLFCSFKLTTINSGTESLLCTEVATSPGVISW